ncbi:MAG TPA: RidA family protein [Firmicutes bacterium]|jgi:2-iminobutanoate/2-iminopropanoate deaminase|nr:RidA family protein [Bacillota bacterium]
MKKKVIKTPSAPPAKGPYSVAVALGELLFISGQGPFDPSSGSVIKGTVEEQTRLVLNNLSHILEDAGSSLEHVLKVTVYLSDMNNFSAMNEVYSSFFSSAYPARTCIQASRLPFDIDVEIEVIACRRK